ncbi:MAG: ABC transporter ATP-binding protein [Elusimicrobia bacterium]|nr:ABC transporter ATP-binding protein [Elusimicrobiota bacterium]
MTSKEALRRLYPYVRPYWRRFLLAAVAMVLVSGFNGASLWLLKPVVDQVFLDRDAAMFRTLLILIPLVFLCKTVLNYVQIYLMSWIGQRVAQDLRSRLFRHLHELSMDFFWKSKSGEVLARVTSDLTNVQSALHFTPLYLVRDSLTSVVLLGMLFFIHWRFALLAFMLLPVCASVLVVTGRKMRDASRESQVILGELYHRFQESLQGMLVVKAFNYEEGAIRKFDRENDSFWSQMMRYLRATALSGPLMELLGGLILTLILFLGGREILSGRMTPGEFMAFLGCFFAAYNPVKNLARLNAELQRGVASAQRIFEVLDERPTVLESAAPARFARPREGIVFEDVSFRYPDRETWALRGLSLRLAPGEVLAVAGPSGSGKTTLAHLLLRLFDPQSGRILVDGVDLREFAVADLRRHIGLVTQDTVLLHDTVVGNVALGVPDAPVEKTLAALRAADAEDFVARLPEGRETILGERGLRLSGGQRQRIAIARAILKDPPILVLDEATSNLDTASERSVQEALERIYQGRTVLVIAHRLSTLQNADRIIVLRQGELVESGTHAELLNSGGVYATLHALQRLDDIPPRIESPRSRKAA